MGVSIYREKSKMVTNNTESTIIVLLNIIESYFGAQILVFNTEKSIAKQQ